MSKLFYNGKLFVVVADFEERQRPAGRDGREKSKGNAYYQHRNAINKMLAFRAF